jgi:competence protein ComEC
MLVTAFVLAWIGRSRSLPKALATGLIAVIVLDPLAPLTAGFWLSFVAVSSLAVCFTGRVVPVSLVRSLVSSQMAVWIGLAIPTAVIFGGLPLVSSLINLVFIPLFSIVLVPLLLVATLLLYPATISAGNLLDLAAMLLGWLWPVLETFARAPAAYAAIPQAPAPVLGIAMLGTFLVLMPGAASTRLLLPFLFLPALAWDGWRPPAGAFELAVLDVGHGLAAVVRTRSRTLVFDTGPKWFGGGDAGSRIVAPYLAALGVREIDTLVISHGDSDHRGGLDGLLQLIPAQRVIAGAYVAHDNRRECVAGERWEWEGVEFLILSPGAGSPLRGNNASCVMRVKNDYGSVLLAGDIERRSETLLVQRGSPLHASLLIAPHHGSRTSSSAAFVDVVRPKWVVFSAPRRSRWGLPDRGVVARWRSVGARTWTTGLSGAVVAKFSAHSPPESPRGWRCRARRFWRLRDCGPGSAHSISGGD